MDDNKEKQNAADLTVREMENDSSRSEDQRLGQAIRNSAFLDLPESNRTLRDLIEVAAGSSDTGKTTLAESREKTPWRSLFAVAASLALLVTLGFLIRTDGQHVGQKEAQQSSQRRLKEAQQSRDELQRKLNSEQVARQQPLIRLFYDKQTEELKGILEELKSKHLALNSAQDQSVQTVDAKTRQQIDELLRERAHVESLIMTTRDKIIEINPTGSLSAVDPSDVDLRGGVDIVELLDLSLVEDEELEILKGDRLEIDALKKSVGDLEKSISQAAGYLDTSRSSLAMDTSGRFQSKPRIPRLYENGSGDGAGFGGGAGGGFGGNFGWVSDFGLANGLPEPNGEWDRRFENSEDYASIVENQFRNTTGENRISTFSIDVDTASYANIRRFITSGQHVPPNAVRIEEMVNYFQYEYEQPEGDRPFSVNMELAACPWNPQNKLLRVGLKGKEINQEERPASNIVFLLDVSGSMQDSAKLPLLKAGLRMMVEQLTANDRVSIVTYAGNAGVVLNPTAGNQKRTILAAIDQLNASGSTNGSAGIQLAYELAQKNFIEEGTNKVFLATDGDLNVGVTGDEALVELITEKASEGVFLTVLGFGTGNLKDSKLEALADNGNGMYAYIDGVREAHKVLVEGISGSLITIAKDVKIQIEFNPNEVKGYRLIGYENRILAREDFSDDTKDAGEIGAGHAVTALYELVVNEAPTANAANQIELKYQPRSEQPADKNENSEVEQDGEYVDELLTLALRFKKPDSDTSERIEYVLKDEDNSFSGASQDFRFAASVASFGMLLRNSEHRGSTTFEWVQETAAAATGADLAGYRKEFVDLVRLANPAR